MISDDGAVKRGWPDSAVAVTAVGMCLICVACGTWLFLRLSGAGDELRALQNAASGSGRLPGGFGDPEQLMARWALPVMLGVLGCSAGATGLWAGMLSRRRPAIGAVIGILPLYVIALASPRGWSSAGWAALYTVLAVGIAHIARAMR